MIAAVAGPTVSLLVARQQFRASLISGNREKWSEELRDLLAEYVGLVLIASIKRHAMHQDLPLALSADSGLLPTAERIAVVKSKILLMINPNEASHAELSRAVEAAYQVLISKECPQLTSIRAESEEITRIGRAVLNAEWHRVKRGD